MKTLKEKKSATNTKNLTKTSKNLKENSEKKVPKTFRELMGDATLV